MKINTIKALTLVSVIAVLFAFAGCSKNEDKDESSQESVIVSEEESVVSPLVGQWVRDKHSNYIYTFNADGTGKYVMGDKTYNLEYSTDGDRITITFLAEGFSPLNLRYTVVEDRLNIIDSFGQDTIYMRVGS